MNYNKLRKQAQANQERYAIDTFKGAVIDNKDWEVMFNDREEDHCPYKTDCVGNKPCDNGAICDRCK